MSALINKCKECGKPAKNTFCCEKCRGRNYIKERKTDEKNMAPARVVNKFLLAPVRVSQ